MAADDLENSTIQPDEEPLSGSPRKALLFSILAAGWVFPSIGALFIIGGDWNRWLHAGSLSQALQSIRFEQWIALTLLFLQVYLAGAAVYYRLHQQPQPEN